MARGRPEEAAALFGEAVTLRPQEPSYRRDLAGALLALGEGDGAVDVLRRLAGDEPDPGRSRLAVARAALESGQPEMAAVAAREALRQAPETDPEPALLLGLSLAQAGKTEAARKALQLALHRAPHHLRAKSALSALPPKEPAAALTAPR
jgi:Flp pilus assembly protein TadD